MANDNSGPSQPTLAGSDGAKLTGSNGLSGTGQYQSGLDPNRSSGGDNNSNQGSNPKTGDGSGSGGLQTTGGPDGATGGPANATAGTMGGTVVASGEVAQGLQGAEQPAGLNNSGGTPNNNGSGGGGAAGGGQLQAPAPIPAAQAWRQQGKAATGASADTSLAFPLRMGMPGPLGGIFATQGVAAALGLGSLPSSQVPGAAAAEEQASFAGRNCFWPCSSSIRPLVVALTRGPDRSPHRLTPQPRPQAPLTESPGAGLKRRGTSQRRHPGPSRPP